MPHAGKKIFVVLGTRPELIKLAPLILKAKESKKCQVIVCSTGQHKELLAPLYQLFQFQPDIDLGLMKATQDMSQLHAEVLKQITLHLKEVKPDIVVVQGDTLSAQVAATAAFYQQIPVAHVEAGLRTYDLSAPFPEEFNRRVIGHIAKLHFCATKEAQQNLKKEKIPAKNIFVTGNTTIDSLLWVDQQIYSNSHLFLQLEESFSFLNRRRKMILMTVHRRESWGEDLKTIFTTIKKISEDFDIDIVFPIHPNPNVLNLAKSLLDNTKVHLLEPLNYVEMVYLLRRCDFVMTDSGGLQEEAPSFGKKVLVLRKKTERPEGVRAGFSKIVGTDPKVIYKEAKKLILAKDHWPKKIPKNPYGDGLACERIVKLLAQAKP